MKIRDTIIDPVHSSLSERQQHALAQALLEMTQAFHQAGLKPFECIEALCVASAHIAHVASLRPQTAQMLRSWADDLEKNNAPIALYNQGTA